MGQPRVMDSLQEEGRPHPLALQRAEGQAEVRALRSGSVGSSVLDGGGLQRSPWARRALPVLPP